MSRNQSPATAVVRAWQLPTKTGTRLNGCISRARTGAADPKEPAAVFWVNDRSTLELDLRRSRRASQRWRQLSFAHADRRSRQFRGRTAASGGHELALPTPMHRSQLCVDPRRPAPLSTMWTAVVEVAAATALTANASQRLEVMAAPTPISSVEHLGARLDECERCAPSVLARQLSFRLAYELIEIRGPTKLLETWPQSRSELQREPKVGVPRLQGDHGSGHPGAQSGVLHEHRQVTSRIEITACGQESLTDQVNQSVDYCRLKVREARRATIPYLDPPGPTIQRA